MVILFIIVTKLAVNSEHVKDEVVKQSLMIRSSLVLYGTMRMRSHRRAAVRHILTLHMTLTEKYPLKIREGKNSEMGRWFLEEWK